MPPQGFLPEFESDLMLLDSISTVAWQSVDLQDSGSASPASPRSRQILFAFPCSTVSSDLPQAQASDAFQLSPLSRQGHQRCDCAATVAMFHVDSESSPGSPDSASPCHWDWILSAPLERFTPALGAVLGTPMRKTKLVEETGSWLGAGRIVYSEPQSLRLPAGP